MSSVKIDDDDDTYTGQIDLRLWARILQHARPYWRQLAGLGACGLGVAAIDVTIPMVTGWLIDAATDGALSDQLPLYGAGYAALFVLLAFLIYLFIFLAGQVSTGVGYNLRQMGFGRLQELPFSFFDVRPVGWLVTRLTADCSKISSLLPWMSLDLVWGTSLLLGITGAMLWLDWQLALAVLAIVPPLLAVSLYYQTKLLASSRLVRKTYAVLCSDFNEALMAVKTTKTLVREEKNLEEFQVHSGEMFGYSIRTALQSAVYLPLVIALGSVGVGLSLWRGGVVVDSGELSLGTLVAFMQYAALFYMPIRELAQRFTQLQTAQAAAERIQDLLDTEPEIRDSEQVLAAIASQTATPKPNVASDGGSPTIKRIELKDVSFHYKEGEPVLSNISLTVSAGQTVALVGATGGGKSTLVSLIARFYEPKSGEILFDGVEIRERSLHWLQSNLGVVLQVPHLFSGTIREAIRYGRLDATDAEVEAAAKLVNAHGFISELKDTYDSEVGEGGNKLSTGQRQLIALARAVLADPQIFIMDEATSSVDTETEQLIQDGIDRLLTGRIAFVIAHRLSTVRSADQILVIDGGQVVERGTHAELLVQRGRYHSLYTQQFAQEEGNRLLSNS
jgi:ATP-binding cassette, subfamily B, bacterial